MRIRDMSTSQKALLAKVRGLLDNGLTLDNAMEAATAFGATSTDTDAVRHTIVVGNKRA